MMQRRRLLRMRRNIDSLNSDDDGDGDYGVDASCTSRMVQI